MLTGDMKKVADQVAQELGIDEVHSELLPADKVTQVERLLGEKKENEKLAFVGDGINDAPVLSAQTTVSRWAQWDRMRQLRLQMSC